MKLATTLTATALATGAVALPATVTAQTSDDWRFHAILYGYVPDIGGTTSFPERGAVLAFHVGPSAVIGGTKTDMVVWANNDVFLQIWIGADDKLPRRVRAIFREDPLALRHEMELSNWQLDPVLPPDTFASAKAQTAGRMAFAAPAPPPRGAKPLTAAKLPAKKQ